MFLGGLAVGSSLLGVDFCCEWVLVVGEGVIFSFARGWGKFLWELLFHVCLGDVGSFLGGGCFLCVGELFTGVWVCQGCLRERGVCFTEWRIYSILGCLLWGVAGENFLEGGRLLDHILCPADPCNIYTVLYVTYYITGPCTIYTVLYITYY